MFIHMKHKENLIKTQKYILLIHMEKQNQYTDIVKIF